MNRFRRILGLALIFSMLLCSLLACKDKSEPEDTTAEPSQEDVGPTSGVVIAEKGTLHYSIAYPDGDEILMKEIATLIESIAKAAKVSSVSHAPADPKVYSSDKLEILIGNTGYAETDAVRADMAYGDWAVCFNGRKLVVAGNSRYAVRDAITELIYVMKKHTEKDGTIVLPEDMLLTDTNDKIINLLPVDERLGLPETMDEGRSCSLAVFSDATQEKYEAYLDKLESEGYTYYTENAIGPNVYHTYLNDDYVMHARYYGLRSEIRVNIEKKTTLVGLESDNVWTKNDDVVTSLAQIGVTGSSDCYQLADGSFIVIDGGHTHDGPALYEYMKSKAPNGEIVVAAWFLTHGDGDHIGCISRFNNVYKDEVKIELVIKNFPGPDVASESMGTQKPYVYDIATQWPGCKLIKAHAGQKFYIRDAVVDILATIGDISPVPIVKYNDTSIIFTIEIAGERALFTGDMSEMGAKACVEIYGESLKSDLLTLPHHGITNGYGFNMPNTIEFMKLVRPEVVFWPHKSVAIHLSDLERWNYTCAWNNEAMISAREVYLSGQGAPTVLELPYRPFSAYRYEAGVVTPPVRLDQPSIEGSLNYFPIYGESAMDSVSWND